MEPIVNRDPGDENDLEPLVTVLRDCTVCDRPVLAFPGDPDPQCWQHDASLDAYSDAD